MDSTADPRATLLLKAVDLATEGDVPRLTSLVASHSDLFQHELVLRILLTYLPESTEPSLYTEFLQNLVAGNLSPLDSSGDLGDASDSAHESAKARTLPLLKLPQLPDHGSRGADLLSRFLVAKAHKIDVETGSLISAKQLIDPFARTSDYLGVWATSTLLPLFRIEYEVYTDSPQKFTLKTFEDLRGRSGLYTLLFDLLRRNKASANHEYARDFRSILGPWVLGEIWRTVNDAATDSEGSTTPTPKGTKAGVAAVKIWQDVFEVLLDHAIESPASIVELAQSWDGPPDVDSGPFWSADAAQADQADQSYAQMLLAMIYMPSDNGSALTREQQGLLLRKVASLIGTELKYDPSKPDLTSAADLVPHDLLASIANIHLDRGELMDSENPLTLPTVASVHLAALLTASTTVLESLGESMTLQGVAHLGFFGHGLDQKKRVQKILNALVSRSSAGDGFWREMRQKMVWLHQWNTQAIEDEPRHGVFCRVRGEEIEVEVLKTLTAAGRFKLLSQMYTSSDSYLPREVVEKTMLGVALAAYDSSESGNKSRGEMKQASDIISTFRHQFPESTKFRQLHHLIQATHALSFYTVKLDNGLPCIPGRLRSIRQPLTVIERVLAQNTNSYTKLDDLIDIGRNLARAGLAHTANGEADGPAQGSEDGSDRIARQIIAKAVEAALAEGDFDTAYSYVVNRLSLSRSEARPLDGRSDSDDDPLWQAAYQAGRYRPGKNGGPSELRRIEQRMELLSQAAQLAPSSSLLDILQSWRECEKELNDSISKDVEEEEQWNEQGNRTIPGGFNMGDIVPSNQKPREYTRGALSEDAPMGLFDVARGAAAAFSKSAFPLSGQAGRGAPAEGEETEHLGQGGRVRKRDMVSSAVTGGLASGIGWMIGANPMSEE